MMINSANLFTAIYNAADAAGYLDDLKTIMIKSSPDTDIRNLPLHNLTVKCEFYHDYDEAVIFFLACYGDEQKTFADVCCPDKGPETYRIMGAAAALMQYVAAELVVRVQWAHDEANPMPANEILDQFAALLRASAA